MALTTVNPGLLDSQAQYTGFKNRIINGAMMIDQRNAGASVSVSSAKYTLDRYQMGATGGGVYTCQQSSTAPAGFSKSMVLTVTTPDSSIAASDYYVIQQAIEGFNISDLGWGAAGASTVTLSFWVRSSVTGTYAGSLVDTNATTSYVFNYTISAANTWEQKTVTISGATTGTWNTTNSAGIYLLLDLGSGSSYNGTAGSWQTAASYYTRTSGSTNWIATNGATFYITGVQLEKGSTATSFDYRPYGTELALCQRYYQKSYRQSVVPGTAGSYDNGDYNNSYWSASNAGTLGGGLVGLPVTMRPSGTLTLYDLAGTAAKVSTSDSGGSFTNNISTNARIANESSMWLRIYNVSGAAGVVFAYTISAEL